MAQIENSASEWKGRSFSRNKKHFLRIDMTPMVDLGFLLITFFVFTTTFSAPTATDLLMPKEGPNIPPSTLAKSLALTLLLDEHNRIYYYHGDFDDALRTHEIFETNFSTYAGIGRIIRQKQQDLDVNKRIEGGRKGMMLLIKPTYKSVYGNIVDALDEAIINDVRKYAIVEPDEKEIDYLIKKPGQ